jgi:catechol 2,3-dioxygenase
MFHTNDELALGLIEPAYPAPFNTTRASHVTFGAANLDRSREFYEKVLGFAVTEQTADTLYLRGLEEICHHSLTLTKAVKPGVCGSIGLRVLTEGDLDQAHSYLQNAGLDPRWIEVPHQGRTLRIRLDGEVPVDFCVRMDTAPRLLTHIELYRGGAPQRMDHFQLFVRDATTLANFFLGLGFRLSEYVVSDQEQLVAAFLQRKGNPHDVVLMNTGKSALHHVAFSVSEPSDLLRACDAAASCGFGASVEFGPGRHGGPGHAQYVYFRDPDGNRIELFTSHFQVIDIENTPIRWGGARGKQRGWYGPQPPASWLREAVPFTSA